MKNPRLIILKLSGLGKSNLKGVKIFKTKDPFKQPRISQY